MADKSSRFDRLLQTADAATYDHQWPRALELYGQALEAMPDQPEPRGHFLTRANRAGDQAVLDGAWDEAEQLYHQALQADPGSRDARNALDRLNRLRAVDQNVQEMIANGDGLLASGEYQSAFERYTSALDTAGQNGIQRYQRELERKRHQALELAGLRRQIEEALAEANSLHRDGKPGEALQRLEQLLRQLPQGEPYSTMASAVYELRERLRSEVDADDLYRQALQATRDDNYELAIELAQAVPPTSQRYRDAQALLAQAETVQRHYIAPALQNAEQALKEQRWADAFAELDRLREDYPNNPGWQRLWLRAGMAHGEQALDHGRRLNQDRQFDEARRAFEQAHAAFEKVLEVYKSHDGALALRAEARDLVDIAVEETQTEVDWRAGRRSEARAALERAHQRIGDAKAAGRTYATVAAVVGSMLSTVVAEIDRIEREGATLKNGERLLKEFRLGEAADQFRQAGNALLMEHQRWAEDGLSRTEQQIRQFEGLMLKAEEATDPAARVEHLQRAYDLWPAGRNVNTLLIDALNDASEAALASKDQKSAAEYNQRALALEEDNASAKALKNRISDEPQIEASLKHSEAELGRLAAAVETHSTDFEQVLLRLEEDQRRAAPYHDLKQRVDAQLERAHGLQQRWRTFEGDAQNLLKRGQWEQALELFSADLAAGGRPPAGLEQHRIAWQQAVTQLNDTRQFAAAQWAAAEKAYADAPSRGDATIALESLQQQRARLDQLDAAAAAIHAAIPGDLTALRKQLEDLEKRANILQKNLRAPSAIGGVLALREALQAWPDDKAMQAALHGLESRAAAEGDQIVSQADREISDGNLDAALKLLQQALELRPQDAEIATRYAQLRRRRNLQEALRTIELDIDSKIATGSLYAAQQAVRQGLDLFLDPNTDLPEDARKSLMELLRLGASETSFATPEQWAQAKSLYEDLETSGAQSWPARQAAVLAKEWLRLARDQALRGVIASMTELGDLVAAYRGAAEYLRAHPTRDSEEGKEAARLAAETRMSLLNRANESADNRLQRAEEAANNGEFTIALDNLDLIEPECYGPIRQNFPALLRDNSEVDDRLAKAKQIRVQAERLQQLYNESKPDLELAEDLFVQGAIEQAEKTLAKALPKLKELPQLASRAETLRSEVEVSKAETANEQLTQALMRLDVRSIAATSADQLAIVLDDLAKLADQTNLSQVLRERQADYQRIVRETSQRKENLKQADAWEVSAKKALDDGRYVAARHALEDALLHVKEGETQVALTEQLRYVEPLAELEAQLLDSRKTASDSASQGRYGEAVQAWRQALDIVERLITDMRRLTPPPASAAFQRFEDLWAEFEPKLDVARAGAALERARRLWEEKRNWSAAQEEIAQVQEIAKRTKQAQELAKEAERFRQRVDQQMATEKALGEHLRKATLALAASDLAKAEQEIEAALAQDSNHQAAQELQARLERTRSANRMLDETESEMKKGNYKAAEALVKTVLTEILPGYSRAVALQERIGAQGPANDALIEAEHLAHNNEFKEAREALKQAVAYGADPDRLQEVQTRVLSLEASWKADTINPIKTLLLDEEYAAAHAQCKLALKQVASEDIQTELNGLMAEIVREWTDSELVKVRQLLQRRSDQSDASNTTESLAKLEFLAALEPPPAPHQQRSIADLRAQASQEVFTGQLQNVRDLAAGKEWSAALLMATGIREEAHKLHLGKVVREAMLLEIEIQEQKRIDEEQRASQEREKLMGEAKQLWEAPRSRRDLDRVLGLADKVLAIPEFADDADALLLRDQAQQALSSFDETRSALKRSRERLNQGQYSDAAAALRLAAVSGVLQADYDKQRVITEHLRQAERSQRDKQWQLALQQYQQALAVDPSLLTLVENDIDRCRQRLMDQVIADAEALLAMAPPKIEQAKSLLGRAQEEQWAQIAYQAAVDRLLNWCKALELTDQVAAIAQDGSGDLDHAVRLLDEAQMLMPPEQPRDVIQSWQDLVKAQQLRNAGQINAALQSLGRVRPPVANVAAAQRLKAELVQAQNLDAALQAAHAQVEAAMRTQPPAHGDAVDAVIPLVAGSGTDNRVRQLQQGLGTRLLALLKEYQRNNHFDDASAVGASLRRLLPDDENVQGVVDKLPEARAQRLQETLAQGAEALRADRLQDAERAYQTALLIAGAGADAGVSQLGQQLADKRTALGSVDDLLERSRTAARQSDWPAGAAALRDAQMVAPGYEPVESAVRELVSQIVRAARRALQANDFVQALVLHDQAAQLAGGDSEVGKLRQDIERQRQSYLAERSQELQSALDLWELDRAVGLAEEALRASPGDAQWASRQGQVQVLVERSETVQKQFAAGVEAIRKRDYSGARSALASASAATAPIRLHEIAMWQEYRQNMEEAAAVITEGRWEQLSQAVSLLSKAESLFPTDAREQLPAIARDLYQWRRQAAWDAQQLRELAARMDKIHSEHQAELARRSFGRAFALLEQLETLQQDYLRRHGQPDVAPAAFWSGRQGRTAQRPLDEKPTPPEPQFEPAAQQPPAQVKEKSLPAMSSSTEPAPSTSASTAEPPPPTAKPPVREAPAPSSQRPAQDAGAAVAPTMAEDSRPASEPNIGQEPPARPQKPLRERNDDKPQSTTTATPEPQPPEAADSSKADQPQDAQVEEDAIQGFTMTWDMSDFPLASYGEEN